jgi:hypothetical protein
MDVDISRELLKWKALDRWENEGGAFGSNQIEQVANRSRDHERTSHAMVEQQSYSDRQNKEAII